MARQIDLTTDDRTEGNTFGRYEAAQERRAVIAKEARRAALETMAAGIAAVNRGANATVHAAVRFLASRCDHAHKRDRAGFSACDATLGHRLARKSGLTAAQFAQAKRLVHDYRGQLTAAGYDVAALLAEPFVPTLTDDLRVTVQVAIDKKTEKAWRVRLGAGYVWVPKSQCTMLERPTRTESARGPLFLTVLDMPLWLARDKGLRTLAA